MSRKETASPIHRLRRAKAALLAVSLTLAGVLILMGDTWLGQIGLGAWAWIKALPLGELGGALLSAGLIGSIVDYSARRDQDEATSRRFRQIISEQAPTIRDAVIEGFAFRPEDLQRISDPRQLDTIAVNAMTLRLGDDQFAREIYADLRDQAVQATERWHDVQVRIRLSNALERSTVGTSLLDVVVEWEYATVPADSLRRFVCTNDRTVYADLRRDVPVTSAWYIAPRPGVDIAAREVYELLELTVDGRPQSIGRATHPTGQIYTATLDNDARRGEPVRIRHIFRTVTPAWGHRLFFELPQPARNVSLNLDYTNTSIADLRVSDTIATARPARIGRTPASAPGKTLAIETAGWLLPTTGFTFTWTLESELPQTDVKRSKAA